MSSIDICHYRLRCSVPTFFTDQGRCSQRHQRPRRTKVRAVDTLVLETVPVCVQAQVENVVVAKDTQAALDQLLRIKSFVCDATW